MSKLLLWWIMRQTNETNLRNIISQHVHQYDECYSFLYNTCFKQHTFWSFFISFSINKSSCTFLWFIQEKTWISNHFMNREEFFCSYFYVDELYILISFFTHLELHLPNSVSSSLMTDSSIQISLFPHSLQRLRWY